MLESSSMQQIFSMSSAVEKAQQAQQQRVDVQARHINAQIVEQHEHEKFEVKRFEKVDEAVVREKKKEGRQEQNLKKDEKEEEKIEAAAREEERYSPVKVEEAGQGGIIDVVV